MNHQPSPEAPTAPPTEETARQMRKLLHDMNNGLEIILQASYLVGTLDLPEDGKKWLALLDQGVQQVTSLNNELRQLVRSTNLV